MFFLCKKHVLRCDDVVTLQLHGFFICEIFTTSDKSIYLN